MLFVALACDRRTIQLINIGEITYREGAQLGQLREKLLGKVLHVSSRAISWTQIAWF